MHVRSKTPPKRSITDRNNNESITFAKIGGFLQFSSAKLPRPRCEQQVDEKHTHRRPSIPECEPSFAYFVLRLYCDFANGRFPRNSAAGRGAKVFTTHEAIRNVFESDEAKASTVVCSNARFLCTLHYYIRMLPLIPKITVHLIIIIIMPFYETHPRVFLWRENGVGYRR